MEDIEVKVRVLFFSYMEKVLGWESHRPYYLNLAKLTTYVSILYKALGEIENSLRWERIAYGEFDLFLEKMSFNYDERVDLYHTNPKYVSYYSAIDIMTPPIGEDLDASIKSYDLIEEGITYQREMKEKLLKNFREGIQQGKILLASSC